MFGEGRYQIASTPLLGKGSSGIVYRAIHLESGEHVAVSYPPRVPGPRSVRTSRCRSTSQVKVLDRIDFEGDPKRSQQLQVRANIPQRLREMACARGTRCAPGTRP